MSLSYFLKPEPEKTPIFNNCQNPNSKKTLKLKLHQIQFWTIEILPKKLCTLAKLLNSSSFRPIFWNPKNLNSKNLEILKPEKLKPEPKEVIQHDHKP